MAGPRRRLGVGSDTAGQFKDSGEVALRNCPDGPAGLARFAGAKFGGG